MGQKEGDVSMRVVMGWVIGVAAIALLGLIMLILFGNLSGNVGFGNDATTITVTNETGGYFNSTGYQLAQFNSTTTSFSVTSAFNATDDAPINSSEFTVPNATAFVFNATNTEYPDVLISYTYAHSFPSQGLTDTNNFISNYTTSLLNTSSQFPVVGTIIGVGLLLFILIALLVFALVRMNKVGGTSRGSFG